MGIQGLIPFLEKATRRVNIGDYAGCCVAIDAYCWLHKGAYSCVEKLARGEPCDAYVHYCMKFVNMLLSHNIKPILVFDGRHLPAKAATEKKRRESRQSSRKRAAELLRAGKTDEARNFLKRCIDVTHDMALALMKECRRRNVDCIVAPYEADAQLAYLNIRNIAQIVITEDSDLVLFGCTKIMFKMDMFGNGLLVEQERLHLAMGVRPENFSFDKFRYMCILSGCDYLPSLPGIGLSKACKFITRTIDPDIHRALSRMPGHLNMRSLTVTDEYRNEFLLADATFKYQMVFDPLTRSLVRLNKPPDCEQVTDYAGTMLPSNQAYQLALGNLNPFTLEKVDDYNPDNVQQNQNVRTKSWNHVAVAPHVSIWSRSYKIPKAMPRPDPCQVERPFTKGKIVLKEVRLPAKPKETVEELLDNLSDTELLSIYGTQEPPPKRQRTDSSVPEDIDVNVENSPPTSPAKSKAESLSSPIKIKTDSISSPRKNEADLVASPIKIMAAEHTLKSPVLVGGKSRRNPFFKEQPSGSPNKKNLESSSMLGLRDGTVEKKFSALSKFGKLRRTEIDEQVVVHSRFFSKQSKTADLNKSVEDEIRTDETLKDVSNTLNIIGGSSHQVAENAGNHSANTPVKQISPKKVSISNCSSQETSLLSTLEAESCVMSPKKQNNSVMSSIKNLFKSDSNTSSGDDIKSCRTYTWSQKFTFQKSKSVKSCFENSNKAAKDFRNPFKKMDYSPNVTTNTSECNGESSLLVAEHDTLDCKSPVKTVDALSDKCTSTINKSLLLSVEGEDEEAVDDPSPADSAVETMTLSSPSEKSSLSFSEDCILVDEGFHSPSSSRLSQSLTLGSRTKSKSKTCRRIGLSKSSCGKQQSLLSMFGFHKKSKLQHT